MLDPPETASTVAKAAKELGWDSVTTTIVMAASGIISIIAWVFGERRGGKKVAESELDIGAALMRHDEQKAIARLADDMNKAVTILMDMTKILSAMDRGQRETHVLLENIFTDLELVPRVHRRHSRGTEDAG